MREKSRHWKEKSAFLEEVDLKPDRSESDVIGAPKMPVPGASIRHDAPPASVAIETLVTSPAGPVQVPTVAEVAVRV